MTLRSNFLTAGSATVNVVEQRPTAGSMAHYITAEGRPGALIAALYPVYYKADTLIDVQTLLPHRGSIYRDERGKRRHAIVTFDWPARTARFEVRTGEPATVTSQHDEKVPADAQDALSAIFLLRATALASGTRLTLPIVVNGRVYRVEMAVTAREQVACGLGQVDAWRVTPTLLDATDRAAGHDMAIWISSDARRLPIKLQGALAFGNFSLTLSSARTR